MGTPNCRRRAKIFSPEVRNRPADAWISVEEFDIHHLERVMRSSWLILAASAVVATSACGSDSSTGPGNAVPPVQTNQVTIGNDFFSAPNIEVPAGTTVTWTWSSGGTAHNVTFSDATSGDRSGTATFSRQFNSAGTFAYHCTIHPSMTGTVLVQ
jgi:plastocyanin